MLLLYRYMAMNRPVFSRECFVQHLGCFFKLIVLLAERHSPFHSGLGSRSRHAVGPCCIDAPIPWFPIRADLWFSTGLGACPSNRFR